ncbi:MAG: hypothetical protein M3070_19385, partial [Actinomycetota bacterium]|nr:hypothetical protein [Actinomycetota bacterium]
AVDDGHRAAEHEHVGAGRRTIRPDCGEAHGVPAAERRARSADGEPDLGPVSARRLPRRGQDDAACEPLPAEPFDRVGRRCSGAAQFAGFGCRGEAAQR